MVPMTTTQASARQIADALRAQITAHEIGPGDAVPTIAELAERWHCTTATAQRALATLKAEGVITGGRGRPATVRIPPRRVRLDSGHGQMQKDSVQRPAADRDVTGALELTTGIPLSETRFVPQYETIQAGDDLAAEFTIEPGTAVLRRTYETSDRLTGHLIMWSQSYIPRALIESNPALLDQAQEPWPGGHQHQLSTVDIELDRFVTTAIAEPATAHDRDRWGMDLGVPMLRTRRRSIDTTGRVVELSDAVYPADRTEICWTEQLRRWS